MSDLLEPVRLIRVTDETTEAEILVSIDLLNLEAKRISRQGKSAMLTPAYKANHERINALLCELELKRACPS